MDRRFAKLLSGVFVEHTKALGWETLSNGALLKAAEEAGFNAFVTVDKGLRFQQNLKGRTVTLITLDVPLTGLRHIEPFAGELLEVLGGEMMLGDSIVLPRAR